MDTQSPEKSNLPISGGLIVVALMMGVLFVTQLPLKSSRPISSGGFGSIYGPQNIPARLWEDPFIPIQKYIKLEKSFSAYPPFNHQIQFLAEQIKEKKGKSVTVLCVMLFGGPNNDDTERRIRKRYAALSALSRKGYVSKDPEHLGCFFIPSQEEAKTNEKLPGVVPYEWFEAGETAIAGKNNPLLLLWLDDNALSFNPLKKIGHLKKLLVDELNEPEVTLDFKIIGPAGSTTLSAMVHELISLKPEKDGKKIDKKGDVDRQALEGIQIFSPTATASYDILSKKDDRYASVAQFFQKIFPAEKDTKFLRTIGNDEFLTDALVEELSLRVKNPSDCYVALISEWDTLYGRSLPVTFQRSMTKDMRFDLEKIYRFSYLRGIDGQLPDQSISGTATLTSSDIRGNKEAQDQKNKNIKKPEGNAQFDYLRRLAMDLEELDREKRRKRNGGDGIRLVGILGSDIYDKLLILQALRNSLPSAIFFTTDLDASLLHPDEFKWTHNLIIASNFDLKLNEDLQGDIPPFRDNYQTSVFLSILIALDSKSDEWSWSQEEIYRWLSPARIFEVGKNKAFAIFTPDGQKAQKEVKIDLDVLNNSNNTVTSVHPDSLPVGELKSLRPPLAAASIFFAAILWINFIFRKKSYIPWITVNFTIFTIISIVVWAWFIRYQASQFDYEPFAWFEGISVWPTEFLRYFAGTIAWYYLFKGSRELWKSNQTLSKKYFTMKKDTDLGRLWNDYQKKSAFRSRFLRIALTSILYFILCGLIINIPGIPCDPCRGSLSYYADKIILLFSVFSLIVLIFWVVDAAKLSKWFIYKISEKGIDWPPETIRQLFFKNYVIPPKHIDDLINIRVIGEHTRAVSELIYYPFMVIILMLISRGSYFDNWNLSISLLIVIMMHLAYSAFCAFTLRHSAESIRQKAVKKLHIQQIFSTPQTSEVSQSLALMLDYIRSNREGALAPISRQPLVHALLIFLGGGGSLLLLEYMTWLK